MSDTLKPCPFCGESAYLGQQELHGWAVIACGSCGTSGPYEDGTVGAHWNRRAKVPALGDIKNAEKP